MNSLRKYTVAITLLLALASPAFAGGGGWHGGGGHGWHHGGHGGWHGGGFGDWDEGDEDCGWRMHHHRWVWECE